VAVGCEAGPAYLRWERPADGARCVYRDGRLFLAHAGSVAWKEEPPAWGDLWTPDRARLWVSRRGFESRAAVGRPPLARPPEPAEKACVRCNGRKPAAEFRRDSRRGLRGYCRGCEREYERDRGEERRRRRKAGPAAEPEADPEREALIVLYQQRAAAGLGVFAGEPRPREPNPLCWCCGEAAPQHSGNERFGWAVRRVQMMGRGSAGESEYYCPGCFAEWGWPDGELRADAGGGP
jgi:hypothetical protein